MAFRIAPARANGDARIQVVPHGVPTVVRDFHREGGLGPWDRGTCRRHRWGTLTQPNVFEFDLFVPSLTGTPTRGIPQESA